jgi:transcription elongation factor GreA
MHEAVITERGLAELSEELDRLTTHGRDEIAARLEQAASREANRLENADYLGVLDDQARLERRIAVLEERLRSAQLVEPQPGNGRVDVGERVRVRDLDSGTRFDLELVGPLEADASAKRISIASPLGKAIVGQRRGTIVEIDAPAGKRRFKILAVESPAPKRRS